MRMRMSVAIAVLLLSCAARASAQEIPVPLTPTMVEYAESAAVLFQTPVGTRLDSLRWEHNTADITAAAVNRFELCYDTATPCATITPTAAVFTPTAAQGGPPAAGNTAYKMLLPALTVGQHSVTVKACNADACGVASSPFVFRFAVVPGTPVGVGLIPGGGSD